MPKKFSLVDGDALCYTLATKSVADFSGACRFSPHSPNGMHSVSAAARFFYARKREVLMKKRTFYTELAYILGLVVLAFSAALMEASDLGVSMIVAPAYLLYLKLSQAFAFFTFGMAEYTLQAALLIVMVMVLGRFRLYYLFSFITAVLYGLLLDGSMAIVALLGVSGMAGRITCFTAGVICCAVGVSLLFHTYIAPEVYELFVKEIAAKYGRNINRVKTAYDCISCLIAVGMSFAFFGLGHFEGVKIGTVLCALVNGALIGFFSGAFEGKFEFKDATKLRKYFE